MNCTSHTDPKKKDKWGTPQEFFDVLDMEFGFTLDPCGDHRRILKPIGMQTLDYNKFPDNMHNGLLFNWVGEIVFCNPPYSDGNLKKWTKKAYDACEEAKERDSPTTIVMLMPPNTDTRYFHDYICKRAEVRFIRGRLAFWDYETREYAGAGTVGSMLVIWRSHPKINVQEITSQIWFCEGMLDGSDIVVPGANQDNRIRDSLFQWALEHNWNLETLEDFE